MSDLADMAERIEERRELERLRAENAQLRRELEEERNPLLKAARYSSWQDASWMYDHPEVQAHRARQMRNVPHGGWSFDHLNGLGGCGVSQMMGPFRAR